MPVVVVVVPKTLQEAWWDMMIEHFNLDFYVEISQYDNEQRYQVLLEKNLLLTLMNLTMRDF